MSTSKPVPVAPEVPEAGVSLVSQFRFFEIFGVLVAAVILVIVGAWIRRWYRIRTLRALVRI